MQEVAGCFCACPVFFWTLVVFADVFGPSSRSEIAGRIAGWCSCKGLRTVSGGGNEGRWGVTCSLRTKT